MNDHLLSVRDLKTYFFLRSGIYKAVDGLDFDLKRGEVLGIVGESGSGKSVAMQSLMRLIPEPPGKIMSGSAMFQGQDLLKISENSMRSIRGAKLAMIFQDPMTSLNPYLKIGLQMTEGLLVHENITPKLARTRAIEALERVGISDAEKRMSQYPHEFSGGMRQRVMIAMAIVSKPDLLIADEPTTALDVTIQAQILQILADLRKETGMGMIFITHDLGVVAGISDRIIVMYAGRPVEIGSADEIFYSTAHPYTRGLLNSIPNHGPMNTAKPLEAIPGLPPDPSRLPQGCAFAARCQSAMEVCRTAEVVPRKKLQPTHQASCHLEMSC